MGRTLKRQWPLIGLVVLLATVAFYLIRSGTEIIQEPLFRKVIPAEGLKLRDIHYTHDDSDKDLKWILDAREVRFSGDKSRIFFRDFRLTVEPENRVPLELKGKKGDYCRDSGDINLRGDLEGNSRNGYSFTTDHVLINEKSECLSTDGVVKITGPFFSVEGRGLFLDMEKQRLNILSDVTTIIEKKSLIW
jgi:LPS export ABC transporter protein LptC